MNSIPESTKERARDFLGCGGGEGGGDIITLWGDSEPFARVYLDASDVGSNVDGGALYRTPDTKDDANKIAKNELADIINSGKQIRVAFSIVDGDYTGTFYYTPRSLVYGSNGVNVAILLDCATPDSDLVWVNYTFFIAE